MHQERQGLIFIIFGVSLMSFLLGLRFYQARVLSFFVKDPSKLEVQEHIGFRPTRISIPSRNLDLPINETTIKNGVWEIPASSAGHLSSSANPGEGGNVVIYGHNKNSLFGPIRWMSKGDLVEITDEKDSKLIYKVVEIVTVGPDKIDYVLPKSEETLTLYTCTGIFDSQRFIIVAKPQS